MSALIVLAVLLLVGWFVAMPAAYGWFDGGYPASYSMTPRGRVRLAVYELFRSRAVRTEEWRREYRRRKWEEEERRGR